MGIRFACHVCDKQLNIKSQLAGKRGICPACSARFRIPWKDSPKSLPVQSQAAPTAAESRSGAPQPQEHPQQNNASATDADSSGDDIDANVSVTPPSPAAERAKSSSVLFDGESTWYVRPPSGGQYGPANEEVFREWITEGRVAATALVWRDGWAEWRDAIEVLPELSGRSESSRGGPELNLVFGDSGAARPQNSALSDNDSALSDNDTGLSDYDAGGTSTTATEVHGNRQIGAIKRKRFLQRAATITVLSLVAIGLVAALLAVAGR